MSLPVVLRPEATEDAQDARTYLESEQPGLGKDFLGSGSVWIGNGG